MVAPGGDKRWLPLPASPQLSPVLVRSGHLADRHVDADHGASMARAAPDQFPVRAWISHHPAIPADYVLFAVRRRARGSAAKTAYHHRHANAADDPGGGVPGPGRVEPYSALAHLRSCDYPGLDFSHRQPGAIVVCGRDGGA